MSNTPPLRTAEATLLTADWPASATSIGALTVGRGQWASAAARRFPEARVVCSSLDLYQTEQCRLSAGDDVRVAFECASDPPDESWDLTGLPLPAHGDAELTRDRLQSFALRLASDGWCYAATDNPQDRWLRAELERLFERVSAAVGPTGVVYRARRGARTFKVKDFRAEYRFRDGERLIRVTTRPGVFSHRRLDTGARALIEAMQIEPGDRVLDLGCGSGSVSFAAALRAPGVFVESLDSNPRAVECTRAGAALNGLDNLLVRLDASAGSATPGACDVVLANPPYFSKGRIAELFLDGARRALRPGGRAWFVTKDPQATAAAMAERLIDVSAVPVRSYWVVSGRRADTAEVGGPQGQASGHETRIEETHDGRR